MRFNPLQLILDLPGRDTAYEFQTVKFNSALPAVTQENVDMRQQVIASVNNDARSLEFVQYRHSQMIVQLLHQIKS
jgi:hypothetical protein